MRLVVARVDVLIFAIRLVAARADVQLSFAMCFVTVRGCYKAIWHGLQLQVSDTSVSCVCCCAMGVVEPRDASVL
jgi:hypothetical protein